MAEQVGVAVVGCGGMGKWHTRILAGFDDVHLRVLVDVNEDAALALHADSGAVKVATDMNGAMQDRGVDAVLVCTHHHLHAPMCIAAAQAGKHTFCEKPLALTMEDCEAIAGAVDAAQVKVMVGY